MTATKSLDFNVNGGNAYAYVVHTLSGRFVRRQRILAGLVTLCMTVSMFLNFNPWFAAIAVFFLIQFVYPHFIQRLLMRWLYRKFDMDVHVEWDDDEVRLTANGQNYRLPWISFSKFGRADEFEDYIVLKSGRGNAIPFPKTSFESEAELDEFRRFVAEKMGDRFHSEMNDRELVAAATE